jgi:hypothetical protein
MTLHVKAFGEFFSAAFSAGFFGLFGAARCAGA